MVKNLFIKLAVAIKPYWKNDCPCYEESDGTCKIIQPTLINMGDDKPLHLLFPAHWSEALYILPEAKQMTLALDAFLVLVLHGEASEDQIESLVLKLAEAKVLPLWIGKENRRKFNQITARLSITQTNVELATEQKTGIVVRK
jgi:hypothetical protein